MHLLYKPGQIDQAVSLKTAYNGLMMHWNVFAATHGKRTSGWYPTVIYLFKVNDRNTRTWCANMFKVN